MKNISASKVLVFVACSLFSAPALAITSTEIAGYVGFTAINFLGYAVQNYYGKIQKKQLEKTEEQVQEEVQKLNLVAKDLSNQNYYLLTMCSIALEHNPQDLNAGYEQLKKAVEFTLVNAFYARDLKAVTLLKQVQRLVNDKTVTITLLKQLQEAHIARGQA